ncbi:tetratricopeptide repeat protein [Candidatus Poribacteria bacterium]|nr:tetratricopeptide repeat protein [Candidatus Poribacteria bacterium]
MIHRLVAAFACIVIIAGCGGDPVERAWAQARSGDIDGARAALTSLAAIRRWTSRAEATLGELELSQMRAQEAAHHLSRAAAADPNDTMALARYGEALLLLGQEVDALDVFAKALSISQSGPHVVYIAGLIGDAYETTRLTSSEVDSYAPSFSPDGTKLVMTQHADGSAELFLMDLASKRSERLTDMPTTNEYGATFSPDGKNLLFGSTQHRTDAAMINLQASGSTPRSEMIYTMDLATRTTIPLTTSPAAVGNPAFTPDGKTVLFEATVDGNMDIWSMAADGSQRERLTSEPSDDGHAVVSPDGRQAVYVRSLDRAFDLFEVRLDGSSSRQVTFTEATEYGGAFLPDGKEFLFVRNQGAGYELALTDWQSGHVRPVSSRYGDVIHPAASPDGKRVAFASNRRDYLDIYLMDLTKPMSGPALEQRIRTMLAQIGR